MRDHRSATLLLLECVLWGRRTHSCKYKVCGVMNTVCYNMISFTLYASVCRTKRILPLSNHHYNIPCGGSLSRVCVCMAIRLVLTERHAPWIEGALLLKNLRKNALNQCNNCSIELPFVSFLFHLYTLLHYDAPGSPRFTRTPDSCATTRGYTCRSPGRRRGRTQGSATGLPVGPFFLFGLN